MPRRHSLVLTPRGRRAQRRALHGSDAESSQAGSGSERHEDSLEEDQTDNAKAAMRVIHLTKVIIPPRHSSTLTESGRRARHRALHGSDVERSPTGGENEDNEDLP